MPTLKRMAECAWEATCAHIEECKSPADVAQAFDVALRAIVACHVLYNDFDHEDEPEDVEIADLDDCPGWQHLIRDEEEE